MLKAALIVLLAAAAPAALAARPLTVEQLRQTLATHAADSDAALAHQLDQVELSEQLTAATLAGMKAEFKPGAKTELALELLADASWFLDPPAAELPARPAPTPAEMQAMMTAAINFVAVTLHRLPNLLATRLTRSFDNTTQVVSRSGWTPGEEMHLSGTFTEEITYRDGREVASRAQASPGKARQAAAPAGLTTSGEFGPVLAIILTDAARGTVNWSHWEHTPSGMAAVINYLIQREASHDPLNFC